MSWHEAGEPASCRKGLLAFREEDREEHDAFGEGGAQDRLHEDRGGGAGITADRFRSLHTDQTHAQGGAEGGETDVNAASDTSRGHGLRDFSENGKNAHFVS